MESPSSHPRASHSSLPNTGVFQQLLLDIAGSAPRTAWVLRLLCKSAAAKLRGPEHATVHVSEPVPPPEFRWRWCGPQSVRSTTLKQRQQLELLTARSGVVANLEALEARGDLPLLSCPASEWGPLCDAAARAGRLEMCRWLNEQRGAPFAEGYLEAAAEGGNVELCEWLLEDCGLEWTLGAVCAATRHGHVRVAERLLQLRPQQAAPLSNSGAALLLAAAVKGGCSLAALQRMYAEHVAGCCGLGLCGSAGVNCLAAAAASPTPDWAAKVEWLEGLCAPNRAEAWEPACEAVSCKDGGARVAWLAARGYAIDLATAYSAAEAGNAEALRYVLAQPGVQLPPFDDDCFMCAACASGSLEAVQVLWNVFGASTADKALFFNAVQSGSLPLLRWLHERGCPWDAWTFARSAESGSLPLLQWLHERGCPWDACTFAQAAKSGSLPLLRWLHECGCPWDARAVVGAAEAGCEEVLEWLAERGCPMGDVGAAYEAAACNADLPTLRCLARLRCPFAPEGSTFTDAVRGLALGGKARMAPLTWLLDAGCPVDWDDVFSFFREVFLDVHRYEYEVLDFP